jgi:hypothetical protein
MERDRNENGSHYEAIARRAQPASLTPIKRQAKTARRVFDGQQSAPPPE